MLRARLTFGTGDLRVRNELPLVVVDHESVGRLHQAEVLQALDNDAHAVFQIEDLRGIPVGGAVDVALRGCCHDQVLVTHRHVDHSVLEVQLLVDLVQQVHHLDLVLVV